jgi:predicted kinase
MLQADYMRKWMSERLKRRKKSDGPDKEAGTKAQEPLQPRFYDDQAPASSADASGAGRSETPAAPVAQSRPGDSGEQASQRDAKPRVSRSQPRPEPADTSETSAQTPAAPVEGGARPRPARRRRSRGGRGGRGRTGGSPAVPVAAAELAATEPDASEIVDGNASAALSMPDAKQLADSAATQLSPGQSAPVQATPAQPRASKGTVILAIGLPGSGKSSWFKRHNIHPLSSDLLRELLFDDAQEQRFQDLVFSNLRSMLKARLIARRPMNYVDATNLTPHDRHSWVKLAKDYGYDVQGLFFDVPLEVCMERHQRRGRVVPEEIMRKMAGKLKPPTFEEGFSKITVVRVKQKEAAAS